MIYHGGRFASAAATGPSPGHGTDPAVLDDRVARCHAHHVRGVRHQRGAHHNAAWEAAVLLPEVL